MFLLPPEKYTLVEQPVKAVEINNLFSRFVTEKHVDGRVYVDDILNPKTIYVVHPYGLSLLIGNTRNVEFNNRFLEYALNIRSERNEFEWMQTYPREWDLVLEDLFGNALVKPEKNLNQADKGIIELHTRVNFEFSGELFWQGSYNPLSKDDQVVNTDASIFEQMHGSVIPSKFWNSAGDFLNKGIGFTLLHGGEIASTAYSAFLLEDKLEIGIETLEKFRGMGFASTICSSLIGYCLSAGYTPVWSCRHQNTASYNLAIKLGFKPVLFIPFYRLPR